MPERAQTTRVTRPAPSPETARPPEAPPKPASRRTPTAAEEVWGLPAWFLGACGVLATGSTLVAAVLWFA